MKWTTGVAVSTGLGSTSGPVEVKAIEPEPPPRDPQPAPLRAPDPRRHLLKTPPRCQSYKTFLFSGGRKPTHLTSANIRIRTSISMPSA